jgi:hypothetical protein
MANETGGDGLPRSVSSSHRALEDVQESDLPCRYNTAWLQTMDADSRQRQNTAKTLETQGNAESNSSTASNHNWLPTSCRARRVTAMKQTLGPCGINLAVFPYPTTEPYWISCFTPELIVTRHSNHEASRTRMISRNREQMPISAAPQSMHIHLLLGAPNGDRC